MFHISIFQSPNHKIRDMTYSTYFLIIWDGGDDTNDIVQSTLRAPKLCAYLQHICFLILVKLIVTVTVTIASWEYGQASRTHVYCIECDPERVCVIMPCVAFRI